MLAKATQQSLEAAAELLGKRRTAFRGTDITPFLQRAQLASRWHLFFEARRGLYQDTVRGNRIITDPRTDTSTLLYDRCHAKMVDLIREFPELRYHISVDVNIRKDVIAQMDYNAAGAPGRVLLMGPQGAPLHIIHLDHQTPANHLYVATPPAMLRRSWRDHLAIFNSDETARPLWDWMMEWLDKSGSNIPVVAVTSMRGRPDKADIARVTVLPVGLETTWASTGFAPGLSRISVRRIIKGCHRQLSANEVFHPLDSRRAWGSLPTILADFVRVSRNLLDEGNLSAFRSFLEETMAIDALTTEDKRLAVESLSQHVTETQRQMMERVMDELCDSPPLDMPNFTYTVSDGCYMRRRKDNGHQSKISNFRAQPIIRMETDQVPRPGSRSMEGGVVTLLRIVQPKQPVFHCLVDDLTMASYSRLMEAIRNAAARNKVALPMIYGREPMLGQIIETTYSRTLEYAAFPCLGFDHGTNSYHYPEISITPLGEVRRSMGYAEAVSEIYKPLMAPPGIKESHARLKAFILAHGEDERMMASLASATALACLFAFKSSRSPHGFHISVVDDKLLNMAARVAGLVVMRPEDIKDIEAIPLLTRNVPVVMKGVAGGTSSLFKFRIAGHDPFSGGTADLSITKAIDITNDEILAVPETTFAMFAEAAFRAKTPEEIIRSILWDTPVPFINQVIHSLAYMLSGGSQELEVLLDFIASGDAEEFMCRVPELPDHVLIRRDIVGHCLNPRPGHLRLAKIRVEASLKAVVGAGFEARRFRLGGDRFYAWAVPTKFFHTTSKIIKLA